MAVLKIIFVALLCFPILYVSFVFASKLMLEITKKK